MELTDTIEKEDGLRLRKNMLDKPAVDEFSDDDISEEDAKTDLVKRIIESTKDCMPTDLPSAKRMVSFCYFKTLLLSN